MRLFFPLDWVQPGLIPSNLARAGPRGGRPRHGAIGPARCDSAGGSAPRCVTDSRPHRHARRGCTGGGYLTEWQAGNTLADMETIIFKAPDGTKDRLRKLNRNISELLREQTEKLLAGEKGFVSAHDKARALCGVIKGGVRNASTSKAYLQQYAPKHLH